MAKRACPVPPRAGQLAVLLHSPACSFFPAPTLPPRPLPQLQPTFFFIPIP